MNSQFHLCKYSNTSKCSETVDVFLKNTTVGDVVFRELDNLKKKPIVIVIYVVHSSSKVS